MVSTKCKCSTKCSAKHPKNFPKNFPRNFLKNVPGAISKTSDANRMVAAVAVAVSSGCSAESMTAGLIENTDI